MNKLFKVAASRSDAAQTGERKTTEALARLHSARSFNHSHCFTAEGWGSSLTPLGLRSSIEIEIVYDPAPQRFYIVATDTDTDRQRKLSLDEEIFAECAVNREWREQMAAEIERIRGVLVNWNEPNPSTAGDAGREPTP